MTRIRSLVALLVGLLAVVTAAWAGQARFHDFGERDDADSRSEVYLWPRESLRMGSDAGEYVQYESRKSFNWCTRPNGTRGLIAARVIQAGNAAEIRAVAFPEPPGRITLQFRYKDHLQAPVSVWADTRDGWLRVGDLPGAFDHRWKTATYDVQGVLAATPDGAYRFRIGAEQGRDVTGDIPIDWARVSDAPQAPEPPRDGYFPAVASTKFSGIGAAKSYETGTKPSFPVGIVVSGARTTTWLQAKELGVSAVSQIAWDYDWRGHWRVYSDGRYVDRADAGLPEWLEQSRAMGLRHLPAFASDGFSWFIRRVYTSEQDAVAAIGGIIRQNRKEEGLLAWVMKTQADSGSSGVGCPLEYALDLSNAKREADPDHAGAILLTGRKPGTFRYFADAADVLAFDLYPFSEGLPLAVLGNILDDARRQIGGKKALWAFVEARTAESARRLGRSLTADEVAAQAWLAVCHGADGVFFVATGDGGFFDLAELGDAAAGIRRFAREMLAGDAPVASALLPPSETVDRMGEKGIVSCDDPNVHFVIQKDDHGFWYLISVNASPERRVNVRFACRSFAGGTLATVQGENRMIGLTPGALTDAFDGYQRHVYRFVVP